MAGPTAPATIAGRLGGAVVSIAAALVILGVSILPFLTPAWIHLEQARAGAAALTGFDGPTLDRVTDSIVHDLVLGGDFSVTGPAAGCVGTACPAVTVLDEREAAHMRDVRSVFGGLALLVGTALAAVAAGWLIARGSGVTRAAWWRAVGRGGRWLAILMAVVGVLSVVAFDAAFEMFHELLFPAGSFSFDPRTERLVQLFPDQFWSDTSIALGGLAIALGLVVAWLGSRRATAAAAGAPSGADGRDARPGHAAAAGRTAP